ncbi:TerB N-terminal domain-containing protein [Deinococcus antarcticus]|uniref:TerB N-terminal domain-containing protein n=1 Tax=Deinococcus antarcticus TaxID=1298767 RepID=A0ABV8A6B6_9DEIO
MKRAKPSPYSFLYSARSRAAQRHDAVSAVPLKAYWTTYTDMDRAQEQWYYYWRDRFRQGEALPTDLSYLFLHTYEILHGVGFETPTEAFLHLRRLHSNYRDQHPKLGYYLVDWLDDFVEYYGIDDQEGQHWQRESGAWATGDRQLQYWIDHDQQQPITFDLFRRLVGYRPDQNKFYRDTPDKAKLDQVFTRAVALTDQFYRDREGKSVFEALRPSQKRAVHRQAFQGAVFEGEAVEYVSEGHYPYLEDGRLGELLTRVVRHAENLARREAGYKTMLRGIDLPEDLAAYLTTHLFPKTPVVRQVQIDPQKLAQLQRESAAIRERLADETMVQDDPATMPTRSAHVPVQVKSPSRFTLPVNVPTGQLTDVEAVADVLDLLSPPGVALLQQLKSAGFELLVANVELPPGIFISGLVDTVNEASQVRLGDILIASEGETLVVVEDYRDELDFLLGLAQRIPAGAEGITLSEPWAALAASLTPIHLAVLERLQSQPTTLDELNAFALLQGSMGSALLEEINEKAQDSLGDILIDPYLNPLELEETYRFEVHRLIQAQTAHEVL